ncbi:MAG TPA: DNA polymerase III subunit gamma/tau [Bacillota bacterium]|nr:DNA polymerase III subunit gamma/tau [Bacillota bacterium]
MAQALYRAYRSKSLDEIVGQEHITTALSRALKSGTISHAYLFTGPRGTGKTSIARILAHEINGLPYEDESSHLDIIEIDAASNRRIDEIRDLRDKVHIAPTSAKYKVYIIDEVHMLTREAFNALLKTLEEPPEHVVFMLATTEVHKLPETIISRTQRYALKPVELPKVVAHLKSIAKQEKIDVSDDAMELIARHGEGSFRDSISLLDQIRNTGEKVTLADVQALLGIAPEELISRIVDALTKHNPAALTESLAALHDGGYEAAQAARQLGIALRNQLLSGSIVLDHETHIRLLTKLVEVPNSANPKSYLEIALLDAALAGTQATATATAPAPKAATPKIMQEEVHAKSAVQVEPHPSSFQKEQKAAAESVAAPKPAVAPPSAPHEDQDETPASSTATLDMNAWPAVLAAVKAHHNTLFSIVRMTNPSFEAGGVTLTCAYAFHKKRLDEKRNKQVLGEIIKSVTGEDLRITCVVGEITEPLMQAGPPVLPPADEVSHSVSAPAPTQAPAPASPAPVQNEAIAAISNIFGGAEVLES